MERSRAGLSHEASRFIRTLEALDRASRLLRFSQFLANRILRDDFEQLMIVCLA